MSRYRCTHAARATSPVAVLCRVLRVSRVGYYAWAGRGPTARAQTDEQLVAQLAAAHARSRGPTECRRSMPRCGRRASAPPGGAWRG